MLARHYDAIFPAADPQLSFLAGLLAAADPGPFLDVACGTGGYVLAVAGSSARRQAFGVDLSPEMIAEAKANLGRRRSRDPDIAAEFRVGDMRWLPAELPETGFAAAACIGNSLPHVLTLPDLLLTLGGIASRLLPEAPLVIQTVNFAALDLSLTGATHDLAPIKRSQPDLVFERRYTLREDGLVDFAVRLATADPAAEYRGQSVLRPWSRSDLESALSQTGFVQVVAHGAFDLRTPGPDAPALVLVGRRKA